MAFKKSPEAPKPAAQGKPAGKKAPPQKAAFAAQKDDDEDEDDDLDEEDDLELGDSDLSDEGMDESDDEGLDEEEDEDDDDDDDENDDEDEEEEVPKTPAKAQQQKTPIKQEKQKTPIKQEKPATPVTNGKRKAEPGGESPPKKIRLDDHIPAAFVVDYQKRDLCDVKLSDLPKDTKVEDLKPFCRGCVDIRGKGRPDELLYAFVQYPSAERAVAAVKTLQAAKLKGKTVTVTYCGLKWNSPDSCPSMSYNTVDVRGIPHGFERSKFAALFPTAKVLKFFADGYAQLKFPTAEDVVKALKNPKCRTIKGKNLQFAMAVHHPQQRSKPTTEKLGAATKKSKPQQQTPGKLSKGSPKTPNQKQQQGAKKGPFKGTPQQQAGKGPKTPAAKFTPRAEKISKKTPGGKQTPGPKQTPGKKGVGA